jgi:Fe-S-cluster-containing dehydrogenase component/DMSO reductase anchor subunit
MPAPAADPHTSPPGALARPAERTLIDELLAEQRSLTAVERFSQKHERADFPAQAKYYRDLIPLSKPAPGQQYAFEVNLDKCTGCKACVSACHSLNGLEENETWRDVGTLFGHRGAAPYQQTVTTACHHCAEPGCLEGCPVMAYDKDPETGIVRHLDDQCIGCQYCTMKCPYGVPKYSERLGIVRKCDMCHDRLAVGEAPACVQACPHEAITIRLIDVEEATAAAQPGTQMLPGAFDSSYTKPTTRYVSTKPVPLNAQPADAPRLNLEHAHWPLIVMLVLSQLAVGLLVMTAALPAISAEQFRVGAFPVAALAFAILNAGLFAAVFHLGRPVGAWRFFLGLRTSWMSREILAFSIFAGASFAAMAAAFPISPLAAPLSALMEPVRAWLEPGAYLALAGAVPLGLVAVFTSAMIYIDTHRAFWRPALTFGKFFGTTFLLGSAGAAVVLGWTDRFDPADLSKAVATFAIAATIIRTALFVWEYTTFSRALRDAADPIHKSARIVCTLLPWMKPARTALFAASTVFGLLAIFGVGGIPAVWATLSFSTTFASQILERYTFFTAVVAPRMPGGL